MKTWIANGGVWALMFLIACGDGKSASETDATETDVPADTDAPDSDAADTDRADTDTDLPTPVDLGECTDMDGDSGAAQAAACASAGGVCVSALDACSEGTHAADADSSCVFDDGPGYCCVPPAPSPTGDSCAATGGVCAPIGGCGQAKGWYTTASSECSDSFGFMFVCCAPTNACDGYGLTTCCTDDGATAFVPTCDRGARSCEIDGTTEVCDQECPAFSM
jgi:hypothetical protein